MQIAHYSTALKFSGQKEKLIPLAGVAPTRSSIKDKALPKRQISVLKFQGIGKNAWTRFQRTTRIEKIILGTILAISAMLGVGLSEDSKQQKQADEFVQTCAQAWLGCLEGGAEDSNPYIRKASLQQVKNVSDWDLPAIEKIKYYADALRDSDDKVFKTAKIEVALYLALLGEEQKGEEQNLLQALVAYAPTFYSTTVNIKAGDVFVPVTTWHRQSYSNEYEKTETELRGFIERKSDYIPFSE